MFECMLPPPHFAVLASQTLEENMKTMTCHQNEKDHAGQIAIGCKMEERGEEREREREQ